MKRKDIKNYIKKIIRESFGSVDNFSDNKLSLNVMSLEDFMTQNSIDIGVTDDDMVYTEDMNEDSNFLGAKTTKMSDKEMHNYLGRVKSGTKIPSEKYKMPFVHPSNITIKDEKDRKFDLKKLKSAIKNRPKKLLQQNEKLSKSGDGSMVFYNIGLPALKGLAVDENTDEFVVVDTCPGAGSCKVYCYAKKGGYVQWKASSMSQTRTLNYLLNDPDGFKSQLSSEIKKTNKRFQKRNIKLIVRWHDAGDFFSPDYLNLAYEIAREHPDVDFYAYTKVANVALGEKPENFKISFSAGAKPEQEKQIDFTKNKHSQVVVKDLFSDLITKTAKNKVVKDDKKRIQFSPENLVKLKDRLSDTYNIPVSSIVTYDEIMELPIKNDVVYNVIVRPGDGDDSANRPDVLGIYLLIH